MASFVSAADVIASAVEIERRGHTFYLSVRDRATTPEAKDFFNFMAEEEKRHESIFSAMLQRVGGLELPAGSSDEEYLFYVRALLDSHALFLSDHESLALDNPLGLAIRFEKDTLLFFHALEDMVPDSEKQHIRACIDEERRHLKLLANRLTA